MGIVDFQVEVFPSSFPHVYQGECVILNYIDFDGAERKLFRNCVDKLQVWGKSGALKKVVDITMYRTEE